MEHRFARKRKLIFGGLLLLLLLFSLTAQAEAAWKKNSNGTYSYYSKGKKVKSKWIGDDYYVNAKGVRQTGWLHKGNKWYYFNKSGKLVKSKWIKSKGKMYYAGANGALYTSGRKKVGKYYYAFSSRGVKLTGKRTYGKKTYFFGYKTGRMLTKQWVKTNKKYYYYGSNGVMAKSQWIGRYYVNSKGQRVTNTWKGDRYLGSNGKAVTGLKKIGKYYYYFDKKTYKKVKSTKVKVNGKTYTFDKNGKGKVYTSIPTAKVSVESTYYSDPEVSDETLLAAIIYCESGNQSYTGQTAVGMVIMNRVNSPLFPSTLREVIYQKTQFEPTRNGSMTRALKNPSLVTASCKKAAKSVLAKYKSAGKNKKVYLKISGKNVDFSQYLFFMTKAAYSRLGLSSSYRTIQDHVFFKTWR